jgi:hypothetical protein
MGWIARRLKSWLATPRAPWAIVLVAVVIALPSLGYGLAADDHFHKLNLSEDPAWRTLTMPWYRLFTFYDGNAARTAFITDTGLSPWWTDPTITLAFFRPVSGATHLLDYRFWPSHPWLMHLHSIAWYAALVAAAGWLYRRVLPGRPWVANLAALLYAVDHTHGIPLGWVANRNAIVTGCFALAAVAAHDVAVRGPARGPPVWTAVSALLLALALGAGEGALAAVGYLVAHALFLDARAWRKRVASLLPQAAAVAAWFVVYRAGNFGARASGVYVEPLREPFTFVAFIAKHVPLLVASELGAPTPDLYTFLPLRFKVAFVGVALLFVAWSATAVVRLWRADPVARFLVVAALLATVPACATFPSGRLMIVPGWAVLGLVAMVGAGVLDGAAWVPARGAGRALSRSFALWACGGHLVLSPPLLELGMLQLVVLNRIVRRMAVDIPLTPDPGLKRYVFVNAPDTVFAPYAVLGRDVNGDDAAPARFPARLLTMASGARTIDLRRTDEHTVIVRVEGGFYRFGTELLTRAEKAPMPVGTKVLLTDVTIEVLATAPDGVPTEASFRFEESADSDAYLWEQWVGPRLVHVHPPAVGEHVTIRGQLVELF